VRRFGLAIIVALLTFSASGVSALVIAEPCTGYEQPGQDDGACPPTCVICGCCAQAVETVSIVVSTAPDSAVPNTTVIPPSLPRTDPRDILHVPKRFI